MALQIEDILSAICTSMAPANANDFQKIYILSTAMEAKLAFDLLVAYGLDAKLYNQPDKTAKLYVTNPTQAPEQLERILAAALAYARALKQIKQGLDLLCSDNQPALGALQYNIAFTNAQPKGKQILIQIAPPGNTAESIPQPGDAPAQPAASAAAQAAGSIQTSKPVKYRSKKPTDDFASGPSVARGHYPGALGADGAAQKFSVKRRIFLYLFGNMATSSFAMLIMLVIIGIFFSLFVFSKAFLCPDFARVKSRVWYCQVFSESDEDQQKQQQQQRQQQIGLQPVQPGAPR